MTMGGVLDVVIGLAFVYVILSLVCLAANEGIATVFHLRARTLKQGLAWLVDGSERFTPTTSLTAKLYEHPLIKALRERRVIPFLAPKLPSYIPARTFTLALIDTVAKEVPDGSQAKAAGAILDSSMLRQAIKDAPIPDVLEQQLDLLIREAGTDIEKAKLAIDHWFSDGMERLSAAYKQRIQIIGLIVAFVIACALNANTVDITRKLSSDSTVRSAIAAQAAQFAQHPPTVLRRAITDTIPPPADSVYRATAVALDSLTNAGLPLGFAKRPPKDSTVALKAGFYAGAILNGLPGLLITALAVSLGAPFWFDILNKVVNIRGAGRAPEEKPKSPEALPPARG